MTVFLVFNCIPDNLKIYRFDDPDEKMFSLLRRSHHKYMNTEDDDEADEDVARFLIALSENDDKYMCVYDDSTNNINICGASENVEIVVAGFML